MIKLELPIPVSLNDMYANKKKGGRVKTSKAKKWVREAHYYALKTLQEHIATSNYNIELRQKSWNFKNNTYNLGPLHKEHPTLSYKVQYSYAFKNKRHKKPCDIANFEKLLSDFLVDIGFMLDDSFIDDLHIKRLPPCTDNPHVIICINTVDFKDYMY